MIKIERKATPHTQEAMDDLQEACNTGRSYNTEHVNQALREVFHGKCYICENKEATSYQIEHLIPHRGDKKLKYDWNNRSNGRGSGKSKRRNDGCYDHNGGRNGFL